MENNNKEERELRERARQLFVLATARMREHRPVIAKKKGNCKTCTPTGFEPCMGCPGSDYPRTQDEL